MIWFTSDWHLGHKNIIEYCNRPFRDTHDMNQTIIDNMNNLVSEDDELVIVGDLAMGNLHDSLSYMKNLVCENVYLIPGNHDRCHPMHSKHEQWRWPYENVGVTVLSHSVPFYVGGKTIVNHFPPTGDSREERKNSFNDWRPDGDLPVICGHVHDAWVMKDNAINVGVDVWDFMPISKEDIKLMRKP